MDVSLKEWQKHLESGIKCLGKGDNAEAEKYLEKSLEEAEKLEVPVIIAFSQRLLATAYVRNQKIDEAERGFRRALDYCQKLENKKGIAEAKAGLANICYLYSRYSEAVSFYKEAINVYPREASPLRLAVLYNDLGQVYVRMKNWDEAKDCFLKSWKLCKNSGYDKGVAEIDLYLGEINYNQGNLKDAKTNFEAAAKTFSLIGEEVSLASALQYLAFLMLEEDMYDEALLYQYRVIALNFCHNLYTEVSESYYLLSNILQCMKLLDEAEESLKLSLRYYKGYELGLAVRYHSLAVIAIMKKNYTEAKEYYFEALRYFQFFGDGGRIGDVCEELTFLLQYKDGDASDNYWRWLPYRYFNKYITKYDTLISLANTLRRRGNDKAALKCSWKALEIAKVHKYETLETEKLIQKISERIRKNKNPL